MGLVDRAPGPAAIGVADRAVKGLSDTPRYRGGSVRVVRHDAVNRQVLVAFDAGLGDPDTTRSNGCFRHVAMERQRMGCFSVTDS